MDDLARRLSGAPLPPATTLDDVPELRADEENGRRARLRRRRRRLLGGSFLAALAALFLLNAIGMARRGALPSLGAGSVVTALRDALPVGREVRVFHRGPVRALANALRGPVRIGLQVGHLDAAAQPDELAELRFSTGAHAHGVDEVAMNLSVATLLADRLAARGFEVDLLPATVPPGYRADLVLSIHADSNLDPDRSGYKSAHFLPARNPHEALLKVAVDRAMLAGTGLRDDDRNVSGNMLGYYAFNDRRFEHAVSRRTPALIVELGYLSNRADLRLLRRGEELATALEDGVLAYLRDIGRVGGAW